MKQYSIAFRALAALTILSLGGCLRFASTSTRREKPWHRPIASAPQETLPLPIKKQDSPIKEMTLESANTTSSPNLPQATPPASIITPSALDLPSEAAQVLAAPPETETPLIIYGPDNKKPEPQTTAPKTPQETDNIVAIMERDARKKRLFRSTLGTFDIGSPDRKVGQGVYTNPEHRQPYE